MTALVLLAVPLALLALVLVLACAGCALDDSGLASGIPYFDQVRSYGSLVGFWQLNEGGGTVAADSSPAATHNATHVNAAVPAATASVAAPGTLAFNQPPPLISNNPGNLVVEVDGARAAVPLTSDLNTAAFSVVVWVRPQWSPSDLGNVRTVATTRENPSAGVERGWSLTANGSNQWEANICDGTTHATVNSGAAFTFTTDYLAITYDGTSLHLYVNGEERGSIASGYAASTVANLFIAEGRPDLPTPRFPFVGLIGHAAYFDAALTQQDIFDIGAAAVGS